jgi:hypothetical protein
MRPSDFHVFGAVMKHLAGKHFATDSNMKQAVTSSLQTLDTSFLYIRIQALVLWWDKGLSVNGYYMEI